LTIVGAMDLARRQNGGVVAEKVMLGIEILAIIAGLASLFWWARVRENNKKKTND